MPERYTRQRKLPKLLDDIPLSEPSSLEQLCIKFLVTRPYILFQADKNCVHQQDFRFRDGIVLPPVLTDMLFEEFLLHSELTASTSSQSGLQPEKILQAFSDPSHCALQICRLRNISVSFRVLSNLCSSQKVQTLELFNVNFPGPVDSMHCLNQLCHEGITSFQLYNVQPEPQRFIFQHLSNRTHPSLKSMKLSGGLYSWYLLISEETPVPLISLDLSNMHKEPETMFRGLDRLDGIALSENEEFLSQFYNFSSRLLRRRFVCLKETLLSLSLFDTIIGLEDIEAIFQLKRLQHLDIGASPHPSGRSLSTRLTVWEILENLPDLVSLDVTATDIGDKLFGEGERKKFTGERELGRAVPRKLSFLGLMETDGCQLLDIYTLADQVSGHHSEHQLMTAVQRYRNRPSLLKSAYNHLYHLGPSQQYSCPNKLVKLIIEALRRHPEQSNLTLTCTANLFFAMRLIFDSCTVQQKNDIVLTVVWALERHQSNSQVIRNLLLTLNCFDIPEDFMFELGRITKTLLLTLREHEDHREVNHIAINLCNCLVCSLKCDVKDEVLKYGFISTMVNLIKKRYQKRVADELMELAWTVLWNVSDETPANSEEIINRGGLNLMLDCFRRFPDKTEIHKNMMGLVGNIAEVKHLRKYLMTSRFIQLFCKLLNEKDQSLEVSYNICGTLSHLMSDGPDAWTCGEPSRDDIRRDMYRVIETWDLDSRRNINYRSFQPILDLIDSDVPECIHWAVWAFCSLTGFDGRYCVLLSEENGIEILKSIADKDVPEKTKELAVRVIQRLENPPMFDEQFEDL